MGNIGHYETCTKLESLFSFFFSILRTNLLLFPDASPPTRDSAAECT